MPCQLICIVSSPSIKLFTTFFILISCYTSSIALEGESNNVNCKIKTKKEIIQVAISDVLSTARFAQRNVERGQCGGLGGPPCYNPFPYSSIEQFENENPNCCIILDNIPGEISLKYRSNISGKSFPKIYLVAMEFNALTRDKKFKSMMTYKHRYLSFISCLGTVIKDPER